MEEQRMKSETEKANIGEEKNQVIDTYRLRQTRLTYPLL